MDTGLRTAYLKLHTAIFLWGFTGLLGKLISLNEGTLVWYRMLLSFLVIGIIIFRNSKLPRISIREFLQISGIGMLVMLHWITFYGSIKLASISIAMACLSSIALFASILEPIVNKAKFDYVEILFSALEIIGISTIYHSDSGAAAGIVVGLISAMLSATFSVFNKRITSSYDPLTISFIELGSGWLGLTLLFPLYMAIQTSGNWIPDLQDIGYLLILSVVCTVLTWILSLQALRKVSAFTMGLALNLEPVYGIILAVLFAGEGKILNRGFYYGAFIILLTVLLHTIYKFMKGRQQPPVLP